MQNNLGTTNNPVNQPFTLTEEIQGLLANSRAASLAAHTKMEIKKANNEGRAPRVPQVTSHTVSQDLTLMQVTYAPASNPVEANNNSMGCLTLSSNLTSSLISSRQLVTSVAGSFGSMPKNNTFLSGGMVGAGLAILFLTKCFSRK